MNQIIVRIRIPDHPLAAMFYTAPSLGLIGLLRKLVALQFESDGVSVDQVCFAGRLPEIFGVIKTDCLAETVASLGRALADIGLQASTQLYQFDPRELICRPLDPANQERIDVNEIIARVKAGLAESEAVQLQITMLFSGPGHDAPTN